MELMYRGIITTYDNDEIETGKYTTYQKAHTAAEKLAKAKSLNVRGIVVQDSDGYVS